MDVTCILPLVLDHVQVFNQTHFNFYFQKQTSRLCRPTLILIVKSQLSSHASSNFCSLIRGIKLSRCNGNGTNIYCCHDYGHITYRNIDTNKLGLYNICSLSHILHQTFFFIFVKDVKCYHGKHLAIINYA